MDLRAREGANGRASLTAPVHEILLVLRVQGVGTWAHASSRPDIIYSSARSTVLFSSTILVASMRISVEVEGCMTAAPSLGLGSIFEPLV